MDERRRMVPGPNHPITIAPAEGRVRVTVAGHIVADSTRALALREATYPSVIYLPPEDVDLAALKRSERSTYCPYKGHASYWSVLSGGGRAIDAAWMYEEPYEPVAAIKGHLAFYPDRVDAIAITPA